MQAVIFRGPGSVDVGERPDPVIQQPTDAVVRVVPGCVCGSDLWDFRGESPHAAGGNFGNGTIDGYETDLDHIADAYQAMDERRAIKSLVRIGDI